jgi:dephospho-CoA kinase
MIKIGLTGGIGSGKTTVSEVFAQLGIAIYLSDDRARALMVNDEELQSAIISLFGEQSYELGQLNRPYIASKVFSDKNELEKLNALVHPALKKDFDLWCTEQTSPYILKEAAILFESGANIGLDKVILVEAFTEIRLSRVMKRDSVSSESVLARMEVQWSDERKKLLSDYVIMNDEKCSVLEQVLEIHENIMNSD